MCRETGAISSRSINSNLWTGRDASENWLALELIEMLALT
jgi:hypothetical protein